MIYGTNLLYLTGACEIKSSSAYPPSTKARTKNFTNRTNDLSCRRRNGFYSVNDTCYLREIAVIKSTLIKVPKCLASFLT